MFSVITNIYNKKTKEPTLMELFTATGKQFFFLTSRDVQCDTSVARTGTSYRCVPCHRWCTYRTSLLSKKKTFSLFLWL